MLYYFENMLLQAEDANKLGVGQPIQVLPELSEIIFSGKYSRVQESQRNLFLNL